MRIALSSSDRRRDDDDRRQQKDVTERYHPPARPSKKNRRLPTRGRHVCMTRVVNRMNTPPTVEDNHCEEAGEALDSADGKVWPVQLYSWEESD